MNFWWNLGQLIAYIHEVYMYSEVTVSLLTMAEL